MNDKTEKPASMPLLEWIAAALGLVVTVALLGFVGWQALSSAEREPPRIVVETGETHRFPGGWVVEVTARNLSPQTAAGVEIEGTLRGGTETTARATLDYVPGQSTREAGLFFPADPRTGTLEVRASGYTAP